MSNVLLNFQNVYNCTGSTDPNCLGTGSRIEFNFVTGTRYKIRLLNTAVDGWFQFSIDNHTFQVVATDLVPIVPFTAESLHMTVGQRYDIIVEANATTGNFWMRANWQNYCATNYNWDNGMGIIRYDNSSTDDPTTSRTVYNYTESCIDEGISNLVPYVPIAVDSPIVVPELTIDYTWPNNDMFYWNFNGTSLYLNWSDPTTLKEYKNESVFPTEYNVYPLTSVNKWVYWVIVDSTGFEV